LGLFRRLNREVRYLTGLLRTLARVRFISPTSQFLICDDLEKAVDRWRARPAIGFEGVSLTFRALDGLANRCAHWALAQGLGRGDTVALILPNRLEYLPLWYGLTKVGVTAALVNNQLTGVALAHCLNISGASHCLVDAQTEGALESARSLLDRAVRLWTLSDPRGDQLDLRKALEARSPARPDRSARTGMTAKDTALYIYTSGTTGLPKAARITHQRAQLFMRAFAGATAGKPSDRLYLALPLYHSTGGLCAVGAVLLNGGSVVLRSGFSATRFWDDVVAADATMFVYVGEMCRYLTAQPRHSLERGHKLRLAFGNGLSPEVWPVFKARFGVPRILEFYGSTEGNVSMFNFDGTPGAIGRVPSYLSGLFNAALASFDVEAGAPVRMANGLCVKAPPGEVGECLGRIAAGARATYAGYVDKAASETKVLHDVFTRGDHWFSTGDLMTRDKDGCFYFVDRVGDTFRWKGENVSTSEVAERLLAAPGVIEATVYGVSVGHSDGRAGMAAVVAGPDFDLTIFGRHISGALAPYAQPVFLRLVAEIETTGTLKHRKIDLEADGFDPGRVASGLFFHDKLHGFVPLTAGLYAQIIAEEIKL
jgi:fatty-acyl-CoA synthase